MKINNQLNKTNHLYNCLILDKLEIIVFRKKIKNNKKIWT